jgi:hypothetical protein
VRFSNRILITNSIPHLAKIIRWSLHITTRGCYIKKIKMRLNACILLLLLVYLIGAIFSVNIKFKGGFLREFNKKRQFIQKNFLFFKYTCLNFRNF